MKASNTKTEAELVALVRQGCQRKPVVLGGGLYLRVRGPGSAQFYFRYSLAGRDNWVRLGDFPDMRRTEAAQLARAYPPDLQDAAVQTVLQQAEALSAGWAA